MIVHMGILYYKEKNKKSINAQLYTNPDALNFSSDNYDESASIKIDNYIFSGIVVTVLTRDPLEIYEGVPGYHISSTDTEDNYSFSLDIVSYYLISKYEMIPKISNNKKECIFKYKEEPKINDNILTIKYNCNFFSRETISNILLQFNIGFKGKNEIYWLKSNEDQKLELTYQKDKNEIEETIYIDINPNEIYFTNNAITINKKEFLNIEHIKMVKKCEYEMIVL